MLGIMEHSIDVIDKSLPSHFANYSETFRLDLPSQCILFSYSDDKCIGKIKITLQESRINFDIYSVEKDSNINIKIEYTNLTTEQYHLLISTIKDHFS